MHHCNIMYSSCDTIYTGVMLNVEIARTNFLLFVCSPVPSFVIRLLTAHSYSVKLTIFIIPVYPSYRNEFDVGV